MSDLKLTAPDMIKLGRLYLQDGRWEGRQLIPEAWVRESTSTKIANEGHDVYGYPYGYLWWLPNTDDHPAFAALGWAGQLIEIIPDLNLVVAVSPMDGPQYVDPSAFVTLITAVIDSK
jgi:CubicO group peptidase (beta-lactamase class C family)